MCAKVETNVHTKRARTCRYSPPTSMHAPSAQLEETITIFSTCLLCLAVNAMHAVTQCSSQHTAQSAKLTHVDHACKACICVTSASNKRAQISPSFSKSIIDDLDSLSSEHWCSSKALVVLRNGDYVMITARIYHQIPPECCQRVHWNSCSFLHQLLKITKSKQVQMKSCISDKVASP